MSPWTDINLCRAELLRARNLLAWIHGFADAAAKDRRVWNEPQMARKHLEMIAEKSKREGVEL
jgi:hypothetical protein